MPQAGVYVLASLISGVSAAALTLASGPIHTESRSPQGTAYNVKRGQSTYDGCRASPCQVAYLNSVEDFCLWAPPQPALSTTRNTEHTLVAWCMKSAQGTRLIPDGTISGARLVTTPEYVQITGVGNLTNINVPADGVASASGEGDGVHGLVFTSAYGQLEQIYDWTSFVSQERFCFRACKPSAAASTACPQIHDVFGCSENVPGNYDTGVFEDCIGDAIEVPSTLYQEVLAAPSHYSAPPPSSCTTRGTIGNARFARARRAIASMSGSTSSALVTSFSHQHSRSHRHSTPSTSSTAPTTTDAATTITFPSFPTSTLTAPTFTNSSIPVSSATRTSTPYSYSTHTHTHSHWHSHTHRRSRHHPSTSSASVSSSSSHHSFNHSRSASSTASSLSELSSTSSASSFTSSTPSFTLTFSTYSSSDPTSSGTSTSFVTSTSTSTLTPTPTPTPASTPTPTSTSYFPSSYGTSSSLSELSSSQPSSYQSSTPSSTATPTSPPTSSSTSPSTPSQSSDVPTFATSLSSSSVPTTSPATSSSTFPNSQTQLGSQCPPASQVATNAGRVVPATPLLPLILTILMSVIWSSVGVLVF